MKKISLIILILFFNSIINAQNTYMFDYKFLIKSNYKSLNNSQYLINSENPDFLIYQYNDNQVKLFDYKNDEVIRLYCTTDINKNTYKFISSEKLTSNEGLFIDHINVEAIDKNKYVIQGFSTSESKKSSLEIIVKLKPANKDLLRFYFLDLSNNIHKSLIASLKEKLNRNYNFMIESYTIDYKNGFKINTAIKKIEKVNLKISLSD